MLAAATKSAAGGPGVSGVAVQALHQQWMGIVGPVAPFLSAVSARLEEQVGTFDPEIAVIAHYALTNQGKQLRPVLVGLSGQAVGVSSPGLVNVAAIIEMIHLATLVHDDIMDEAVIRRGRPTLAAHWGNSISVLLGDCLFAHALKLAAGFPTTEVCRAVSSATKTVCSGEILQTQRRRRFDLTRADYFKFIEMKTAELFALSCELGASVAGGTPAMIRSLREFGIRLGTAYQVYDDCLDLFGTEEVVGKSLGTDLARGKLTLPVLHALETSDEGERSQVESWIATWDAPRHLSSVLEWLDRHGALPVSQVEIRQQLAGAREALRGIPEGPFEHSLRLLADFLEQQAEALGV